MLVSSFQSGKLQDVVVVLSPTYVSGGGNWATGMWNYWVTQYKVNFPIAGDEDRSVSRLMDSSTKPSYVLLDLSNMKILAKSAKLTGKVKEQLGL